MQADRTTPAQPTGGGEAPSFSPRQLLDLFIAPRRFFSAGLDLASPARLAMVTILYGIALSLNRIQARLSIQLKAHSLGLTPSRAWSFQEPLSSNWLFFWAYALVGGLVTAVLVWWIGGWWFGVRVRWSGAVDAKLRTARQVYLYSALLFTLPAVIGPIVITALYPDYRAAWSAGGYRPMFLLPFLLWSTLVSYIGVTVVFPVRRGRAFGWFVILPWVLYVALTVFGTVMLRGLVRHPA